MAGIINNIISKIIVLHSFHSRLICFEDLRQINEYELLSVSVEFLIYSSLEDSNKTITQLSTLLEILETEKNSLADEVKQLLRSNDNKLFPITDKYILIDSKLERQRLKIILANAERNEQEKEELKDNIAKLDRFIYLYRANNYANSLFKLIKRIVENPGNINNIHSLLAQIIRYRSEYMNSIEQFYREHKKYPKIVVDLHGSQQELMTNSEEQRKKSIEQFNHLILTHDIDIKYITKILNKIYPKWKKFINNNEFLFITIDKINELHENPDTKDQLLLIKSLIDDYHNRCIENKREKIFNTLVALQLIKQADDHVNIKEIEKILDECVQNNQHEKYILASYILLFAKHNYLCELSYYIFVLKKGANYIDLLKKLVQENLKTYQTIRNKCKTILNEYQLWMKDNPNNQYIQTFQLTQQDISKTLYEIFLEEAQSDVNRYNRGHEASERMHKLTEDLILKQKEDRILTKQEEAHLKTIKERVLRIEAERKFEIAQEIRLKEIEALQLKIREKPQYSSSDEEE